MSGANIHLSLLGAGMPGLTPICGLMLAEAAAVCLEDRTHKTGVTFDLAGIATEQLLLEWDAVDEQKRKTYHDMQEATEWGACGLAILMIKRATGQVVLERSRKGLGFDYWIGSEDVDTGADLFAGKARLEVSGILEGTQSQLKARVKQKKLQIEPSKAIAPGYVAVTEFSAPVTHVESA